jgi:hypothetical protein
MLEPASVALKLGFLAVLYLFLLWVSRSALKDLRRAAEPSRYGIAPDPPGPAQMSQDATGVYAASRVGGPGPDQGPADPRLVVERAPGHTAGMEYDLGAGAVLGRGEQAEIRLEDPFASSRHAQISRQGQIFVIEDLGSTNGTYLNEELLGGPQPLHPGDRVRIGDSEFTYAD